MDRIQCLSQFLGLLCIAYMLTTVDAGESNCRTGDACNSCPDGHFHMLNVNNKNIRVCCDGCKKYIQSGHRISDGLPYCSCYDPKDIAGDCWKGDQCSSCDSGSVGHINSIPVCCANCEDSGLAIGGRFCSCLHNGK
ncbi:uncharacterized protein LOC123549971 [Mercenaria mercenaria]|uniref:uncharacterized protein LOC123549971 n=1 Tax=Mercenaria mercenaria TaxID=6596 RepID=UPI00234E7BEE|nr:uncharacterized protein LOC123549971 [Mercenaria mercenaria]